MKNAGLDNIDQAKDLMKYTDLSSKELAKQLENSSIESILGIDKKNLDYFMKKTNMSEVDILAELKKQNISIDKISGLNVDEIVKKLDKRSSFKGTLKGKEIELPNVSKEQISYTKRNPIECTQLRNKFNTKVRGDFLKDFASKNADKLKELGFTDVDIAKLNDGLVPKGYQVHHKLPLDDRNQHTLQYLSLS